MDGLWRCASCRPARRARRVGGDAARFSLDFLCEIVARVSPNANCPDRLQKVVGEAVLSRKRRRKVRGVNTALAVPRRRARRSWLLLNPRASAFPPRYPAVPLLVELKSDTLPEKLLQRLVRSCEAEAKKLVGSPQLHAVAKLLYSVVHENMLLTCLAEVRLIKVRSGRGPIFAFPCLGSARLLSSFNSSHRPRLRRANFRVTRLPRMTKRGL